jgi:polyisoprenoid-binding protein YceI
MSPSPVPVYQIEPAHSAVHFSVRHLMISTVRGEFSQLSGEVGYDPAQPQTARIDAVIAAASIHTRDAQRDAHLRGPDFLDAEKFPSLEFHSSQAAVTASGLSVPGQLTLHGVTRPVTLEVRDITPEVKDPFGGVRRGATAQARINRKDFGLTYNMALETGGVLVGEEINIQIELELLRKG